MYVPGAVSYTHQMCIRDRSPEEVAKLQPPKEVRLISWKDAQAEHAVDVWITKKEPQEDRKTLVLAPKTAVLGMGCRKNKSYK